MGEGDREADGAERLNSNLRKPEMTTPSLTACMPNYNHGKYIAQAIEAVVSQTRPPDEYIIIDDGSTDDSCAIIESYARKYSCIRFVRNDHNCGAFASWARLVELATGDYLYGGAADDYVLPGFFEKAMQMAERYPQAGLIAGKWAAVDEGGKQLSLEEVADWRQTMFVTPQRYRDEYLPKYSPMHTFSLATIYNKRCLAEVGGFRQQLGFYCDTFAIRAICLKFGFCYIPENYACWRTLPNSLYHSALKHPQKELDILLHSVRLMKSREFDGIFPSDYVRKWSAEYRGEIINRAVAELNRNYKGVSSQLWQELDDGPMLDWVLKRLWWQCDRVYRLIPKFLLRRSLRRYVKERDYGV